MSLSIYTRCDVIQVHSTAYDEWNGMEWFGGDLKRLSTYLASSYRCQNSKTSGNSNGKKEQQRVEVKQTHVSIYDDAHIPYVI